MKYDKLTEIEKAVHHILWIWKQYGDTDLTDGHLYLNHKDMTAGEDAGEWLQELGYVECGGWCDKVTDKGMALLDAE